MGFSREDILRTVKTGHSVKESPARTMLELAHKYLEGDPTTLPIVQIVADSLSFVRSNAP